MDGFNAAVQSAATSLTLGTAGQTLMSDLAHNRGLGLVDIESLNLEEELTDGIITHFLRSMTTAMFPHVAYVEPSIMAAARVSPAVLKDAVESLGDLRRRFLCFPTNIRENHWVLITFDRQEETVKCFDPLVKRSDARVKAAGNLVKDVVCDAYMLSRNSVAVAYVRDIPAQNTELGCGPVMLGYLLAVVQKVAFNRGSKWLNDRSMRLYVACVTVTSTHKSARGERSRSRRAEWWDDVNAGVPAEVFMLQPNEMVMVNKTAYRNHPWTIDRVRGQQAYIAAGDGTGLPSWQTPHEAATAAFDVVMYQQVPSFLLFSYGPVYGRYSSFATGTLLGNFPPSSDNEVRMIPDTRALTRWLHDFSSREDVAETAHKFRDIIKRTQHGKAHIDTFVMNLSPQDLLTAKQLFKFMYFGGLFLRRWIGPGGEIPVTPESTRMLVTNATLSPEVRAQFRHLQEGRADGAWGALVAQMTALRLALSPQARARFDNIPLLFNKYVQGENVQAQFLLPTEAYFDGARTVQAGVDHWKLWAYLFQGVLGLHVCVRLASTPLIQTAAYMSAMLSSRPNWAPPEWLDVQVLQLGNIQ